MATKRHKRAGTPLQDGVRIKGMFRVHIENPESGEIVGDSGWVENTITNNGFQYMIVGPMFGGASSSTIGFAALGTGTAPATNATALPGEISGSTKRTAITAAATASNRSGVQYTATFSSANSFLAALSSLSNVGLFGHSSAATTIACGNTYASSTCDTNQNVNVTYVLSFS